MDPFEYEARSPRVVFGSGSIQKLPDELARLKVSRPLLITGPKQTTEGEVVQTLLADNVAGLFTEAAMHTPTTVTDKAFEHAKTQSADSIVSVGGGSAIGLGKAVSIRLGLPHICLPTTYAGSEMTSILGETAEGKKTTRSDPKILPATVIYDVDLTKTLPLGLSATSGINAIAHAGEIFLLLAANWTEASLS